MGAPQPQLLIINGYYPRPDIDSGSICSVNLIRMAQSLNFAVSHIVPSQFAMAGKVRANLEAMGVRTIGAPQYGSAQAFLEAEGSKFAVVVLSGFRVGAGFYNAVRARCPQARIIFNSVDMHHVRYAREAALSGDEERQRMAIAAREAELFLVQHCDATIVVSDVELRQLQQAIPGARVFHIPLIRDIPGTATGYAQRADVAFVGHYRHAPNLDAVLFFARAIWPRVRRALPDVRLRLIGAGWPGQVPLPDGEGIDFVGHVAEIGPALEQLRLTVAPLRFGAGAKGKVVTSLSHGVPCVATPIAAEGMGFANGVNMLIASDADQFAEHVVRLYDDEALWNRISAAGLDFVGRSHSLANGLRLLGGLMSAIGALPAAAIPSPWPSDWSVTYASGALG